MKFLKKVKNSMIKRELVEAFEVDGTTYKVFDIKSAIPFYKNRRELLFKGEDGRIYIHSSIYLNKKYYFQPVFLISQEIAEIWGEIFEIKNALVLGCAGCAFPRFLVLRFPGIKKIVGIELLGEFVEIAKKHFFIDQIKDKFELLQGDAYDYVENQASSNTQNMVFVDIFSSSQIPENTYSESFIKKTYDCMDENGIAIFNFIDKDISEVGRFVEKINVPFDAKYVVSRDNRRLALLIKTTDAEKLGQYEEKIKEKVNVVVY